MNEPQYYIVSKKHMKKNEQNILLWGTDFCGYTIDVDKAGKYTETEVRAHYGNEFPIVGDNFYYYIHNAKIDNFLIAADEKTLKKMGLRKVTVITYL